MKFESVTILDENMEPVICISCKDRGVALQTDPLCLGCAAKVNADFARWRRFLRNTAQGSGSDGR